MMRSKTTLKFRTLNENLPKPVQTLAVKQFNLWKKYQNYPSLHFKLIHTSKRIYSIRIGLNYRALAVLDVDTYVWFWIGTHEEYNHLINRIL